MKTYTIELTYKDDAQVCIVDVEDFDITDKLIIATDKNGKIVGHTLTDIFMFEVTENKEAE